MMSEVQTNIGCEPALSHPEFICEKCQRSFSRKCNFYRHMRTVHHVELLEINRGKVCGLCNEKLRTRALLYAHFTEEHDVTFQFTEETFYCEDDFLKWKSEIEREGQSNFVLSHTSNNAKDGGKLQYFACHRSGFPNAVVNNKQHPKSRKRPSMKLGFTCPATIKRVSETVDGISCIKVKYQSVHVGHELGVKLRISMRDKARLASALKAGVSVSSLMKELRENYDPCHPYRQITRKDLYNINRTFKLSKTRSVQRDDFVTVDVVVKKILNSDLQTAVLVYKPVGETLPEHPDVHINDFLLGMMNDVQEKLLEMHGNTCIMIDYNDCEKFYLSIIMVQDEFSKSLPVAIFFSSKTSVETLQPFFEAIHRRLPQLKTKVVMSDDLISFYNAWQKVFKDESQHLLCSWYVRKNFLRNVDIKVTKENKRVIKNYLKTILKEEDIASFEFMMQTLIKEYEMEEKDFITYFKSFYEPRSEKWARCYRIALGVNPDMRLERWRDQLKLGKRGDGYKRLDKILSLVLSTIANKLISNAIVMDVEKLTARTLLCQKLHEESLSMGDECKIVEVSEKKCTISEIENGITFSYVIEKLKEVCECQIRCETCNICIHSMSCTCVVYCVHIAICKHMHRFCKSFAPASNLISFCDGEPIQPLEMDDVLSTEPISNPQFIIDDIKARVKEQWQILESRMEDINYLEVMKNVEERMNSINSYLDDAIPSCSFLNAVSNET